MPRPAPGAPGVTGVQSDLDAAGKHLDHAAMHLGCSTQRTQRRRGAGRVHAGAGGAAGMRSARPRALPESRPSHPPTHP